MDKQIIYHEIGKDFWFKTWHASGVNMIIYMHSDGGSIVCNEQAYPIKKGALCFVGAGKYHYTMPDNPKTYDRSKLFISVEDTDKILNILHTDIGLQNFSAGSFIYALIDEAEREAVEEIFRKIKEYEDNKSYGKWILISGVIELLAFLSRCSLKNIPALVGVMNKAIEYINSNISESITIDEICSEIHISKYHFCRQFKIATGTTVMKYILKTRIVMAKEMLLNENLSITEISSRCGFSSIAYFSRVFKEETGVSPIKYKKERKF